MSQTYPYAQPPFRRRRPVLFFMLVLGSLFITVQIFAGIWNFVDGRGIFSGPRIGVARLEGFIGDAERFVTWTEKLRTDRSVAGVLIRIDSPGGAVAPSQEIYSAIKRLAKAKPVVVSMGTVAASGGYYAAVAGREIFANPSTLTGSIGVRLQLTNAQGLMERIGVTSESLTTGPLKAAGSPFEPLTPEQRTYLKSLLDDMQDEFVRAVAEGRNLPLEAVLPLADGRILTGRQALKSKLIDSLGDQNTALARLTAMCKLEGTPQLLTGPEKFEPWWKTLLTSAMDLGAARSAGVPEYMFCY